MHVRPRTINLVSRLLIAIVIAGLLPLIGITVSALNGYRAASDHAVSETTTALDAAALAPLQERAKQTAQEIGDFLDARAADVRALAALQPEPTAYVQFVATRTDELWYQTGTRAAPVERNDRVPFYRELVAIDGTGHVLTRVVDGKLRPDPGDPSRLASYLSEAKALAPDALFVSHLTRLYTPRPTDEATRPPGADYATFDGVYRFIAARHTSNGTFDGAVMLALDARHIMEFVVHIHPTNKDGFVVWPDISSGDYAALFDDEGWTIAHPRLWTVRGDDTNGQPVPTASGEMSSAERDHHPLNANSAGWADPNLPVIFDKGIAGNVGSAITSKQMSLQEAMTYAPVAFTEGSYHDRGMFGVLAIRANPAEFHQSSRAVAAAIDAERRRFQFELGVVATVALILLALAGVTISRMLVRPLTQLTAVARQLEQGKFDEEHLTALRQRRFSDEVTVLANVFADMGRQVVRREQQLRTQIADLHIQIDTRRRQQQVDEITETDYFRNLRDTATRLRSRAPNEPSPDGDSE